MHLKRQKTDKKYPIKRKGTKFVVRPRHSFGKGVPLLIVLRDMLKICKNRKEAKQILNNGFIEVNGKKRKDERFQVVLFDIVNLIPLKKIYQMVIKNKRFSLQEKKENQKISKIVNKKILKKNKIQINLYTGENFITKEKIKTGDSVIFDFSEKKIKKIIPLEKGSKIIVIKGKHIGDYGKIESKEGNTARIEIEDKKIEISLKDIMAV
jgi:small subunit ribosomal protein S4e